MLALLTLMTVILIGAGLRYLEAKCYVAERRKREKKQPLGDVILPSSIKKQEDLDWFIWTMEMAGLEGKVLNTCDCGFAAECYMHCNHDLSDKCTGHAWKPIDAAWSGKFLAVKNAQAQTPELMQYQTDSVKEQKIAELANIRKAHREARITSENIRKEIDRAHIEMKRFRERADSIRAARTRESYDPKTDLYTLDNGRKISRLMYEDLVEHGRLEAVYEFGREEPVLYLGSPLERKWTERLPAR